jgi:ferredoxin-nitrite reductase
LLGGVTGHQEFAEDCGVICRPEDATDVIAALTRAYIRNGNRTNRGKSRLIYLLKKWGLEKYLSEAESILGEPLLRLASEDGMIEDIKRPAVPHAHAPVGVHAQKQKGMNWLGVYVPVGLLQSEEARIIANVSERYGNGEMRLTIYQNIIIPHIPDEHVEAAKKALAAGGLRCEASLIRGGVAACTGHRYCKYASSDTKGHALEVVDYLEGRITLDQPITIHVTGCPHSCAQHYIGDIGLLACKVKVDEHDEPVEGYHVFVGGGFGSDQKTFGRQLFKSVPAGEELNRRIHALLVAYLKHRESDESFVSFSTRHDISALESLIASEDEIAV